MRHQQREAWCGVASVQNALQCLGVTRTQNEIAKLCGVSNEEGANEVELKRALLALGISIDECNTGSRGDALYWLAEHVGRHGPAILCLDDFDHWCTVIGRCGLNYIVFDPARSLLPYKRVKVYTPRGLCDRWYCNYPQGDPPLYGIGCSK